MFKSAVKLVLTVLVGLGAWGCAPTQLVSSWQDPRFSGPPLQKIMVIGVTKQAGIRRTFEDEFVKQLQAKGVQAVQGYTLIPEDGEVPKERVAQAVKESGVEGVLITRLVKVERQSQVYPGTYAGAPGAGFYGYYSASWNGFYEPAEVYTYDQVTAETNLFAAKGDLLIWSGTTQTFAPSDIKKDTKQFVSLICKTLVDKKLI
jgi:hypothetical protein